MTARAPHAPGTTAAARGVAPSRRSPPEPDAELLRRLVARDREAFERLHALYAEFVHAVATRFDPSTAADVSQEVFLTLWQRIDRYEERARFSTWLFRVVANAALDAGRRRRRRPESPLDEGSDHAAGERPRIAIPLFGPATATSPEERIDLAAALATLSPKLRLPLVLRFWGGLDYDEIGKVLGLRSGTVASRLHRALDRLATHLDPPSSGSRR